MADNYQIQSDTLLWNKFISSDEDAFRLIYKSHVQTLFKYGCNFTHDEALIKDCIQDVFVDLMKYRSTIGSTNNIRLYLFKSLKRKIIRSLHKSDIYRHLESDNFPFLYALSSEEEIIEDESIISRTRHLELAMSTLSPRQKEAIYLKYVSNLSYDEISSLMKMNYQSARNLIFRGLEKLRESFPKEIVLLFLFGKRLQKYF
ncbi:MAG: sigma-70 family RNA polymerase sigma factor [Prolixibacteraceae bacterium]|jgi:RNA polymerase sigma factor (sigma-70 family)|nr:sigma-70 family RNA polymerase sigma factor [Prolixibacteraceae bacterium]